ncbi:UbiA family prenyltransferase [Lentisphaerota bacterium WC36G]|nr:hypothetical protein LJT99_04550 [Lentisphaerae bacterium WC36]
MLSNSSPFLSRLNAYFKERFPLFSHGILIISYYSSNQFLAQILQNPDQPVKYSFNSLLGVITLFMIFLHLRVFDEHKDYQEDCKYYPERLLSRGIITLKELKFLGAIAIGFELLIACSCGFNVLSSVLLVLAFSVLMLKEFFVGKWLKKHFLIYATSHMLIMPLMSLMVFSFTTSFAPWEAPAWYWLYAFVGFFVTFNWEVSRKIRTPEDEKKGLDSYSKIFGTYGAAYMVILIRVIDTLMVAFVGWYLNLSYRFYLVLITLFLVCCIGLYQFRFNTCRKTARRMETYAGMYIIVFDLTLAIEILLRYSIQL